VFRDVRMIVKELVNSCAFLLAPICVSVSPRAVIVSSAVAIVVSVVIVARLGLALALILVLPAQKRVGIGPERGLQLRMLIDVLAQVRIRSQVFRIVRERWIGLQLPRNFRMRVEELVEVPC